MDPNNSGANIGDPQTWNAYGYVRGNPLNGTDPSGMFEDIWDEEWDGGEGGGGGDDSFATPTSTPGFLVQYIGNSTFSATALGIGDIATIDTPSNQPLTDLPSTSPDDSDPSPGDYDVPIGDEPFVPALRLVGQNVPAQKRFLAKFAAASLATAVTAPVATNAAGTALNRAAFGPATGRLFYSAGQALRAADTGAGRLLGNSLAGRAFGMASRVLPGRAQAIGWGLLSRYWAAGAAGQITYIGGSRVSMSSHWITEELPVLLRNPNVNLPILYW